MPTLNHTHTFVRYKTKTPKGAKLSEVVWRCNDPLCTFVTNSEMVISKMSRCNCCMNEFLLDREAARRVRPFCLNCGNSKKAEAFQAASKVAESLFSTEVLDGEEVAE